MKNPSYKVCLYLKKAGYSQQGAEYYYFNKDHKIYSADKIVKFAGWERLYIAAPTDPELNRILPITLSGGEGSLTIVKETSGLWSAGYLNQRKLTEAKSRTGRREIKRGLSRNPLVFHSTTEVEAKAMLVKYLLYKKIITLEK